MAITVDTLDIKISADDSKAIEKINGLKAQLSALKSLSGNYSKIRDASGAITSLANAVNSIKPDSGSRLKALSEGLASLAQVRVSKTLSSQITAFRDSVSGIDDTVIGKLERLSTGIQALDGVSRIRIPARLGESLRNIVDSVSDITEEALERLERLTGALAQLQNVDITGIARFASTPQGRGAQNPEANIPDIGTALSGSSPLKDVSPQIERDTSALQELQSEANSASPALQRFKGVLSKLGGVAKSVGIGIKNLALNGIKSLAAGIGKKLTGNIQKATSAFSKLKSSIGRIAFYRAIRSAMRMVTEGFKEGVDNLYKYSDLVGTSFAPSMDRLASSFLYLKNSLGAVSAPLIEAIAPAVDFLIDKFVALLNVIGKTFAALSGKSTYSQAKRYAIEYGDSLNGAAGAAKKLKDYTFGFDELNVFNDNKNGSGGSSGSAYDYSQMFEEVEVDSGIKDIADAIKSGDWDYAASMLASKINDMILSVDAESLGEKIAGAINKGVSFATSFLGGISFQAIGDKVGDLIATSVEEIDWKNFGQLSVAGINLVIDFVSGITDRMSAVGKNGKTGWQGLGNAISDFINSAVNSIKLPKLTKTLSNLIKGLNKSISSAIKNLDWQGFASNIADAIGNIDISSIVGGAAKVLSNLIVGVNKLVKGLIKKLDWVSIGEEITHAIKQILSNINWGQLILDSALIPIQSAWGIVKGVFGAIKGIFTSSEESDDYITADMLELQNRADAAINDYANMRTYLRNLDFSVPSEQIASLEYAKDLVADIFNLNGIENKTPTQLQEMITKIEILNGLGLDGISVQFNELTGSVEGSRTAVLQNIDALKQQYELEAKKEVLADMYKKQYEQELKVTDAKKEMNAALKKQKEYESQLSDIEDKRASVKEKLNEVTQEATLHAEKYGFVSEELQKKQSELRAEAESLNAQYGATQKALDAAKESAGKAGAAFQTEKLAYEELGEKISVVSGDIVDSMRKSGASSGKAWIEEFEKNTTMIGRVLAKAIDGVYFDLTTSGGKLSMKTRTITAYAEGGFPDRGEMFVANENGAEYIGAIGNRTAVANNDQIVKGITYGVASGNDPVVAAICGMAAQIVSAIEENSGNITIGDEVIGRAAKRYDRDSGINTSQGAFAYAR